VILLSDAYLANGSEPWRIPDVSAIEHLDPGFASAPNHVEADGTETFWPYVRDEETLARPWAPPGLPGLEHRIGGIEKSDGPGSISYDGANHEHMSRLRHDRIKRIARSVPDLEVDDPSGRAPTLVVGWGSTFGAIHAAVARLRATGQDVARVHLVHLNPFPSNLAEILARYERVLVPELNLGQLSRLLRAEFLIDAQAVSKVQGLPFRSSELEAALRSHLGGAS